MADGAEIFPVETRAGIFRFIVPRNVRSVSLEPDRFVQTNVGTSRQGISVAEIKIRSSAGEDMIPADDPRLSVGWFAAERDDTKVWRRPRTAARLPWTNVFGSAVVTIRCTNSAEFGDNISALTEHSIVDTGSQQFARAVMRRQAPPEPHYGRRMQWCVGMYSSGSTWVFNAIRSVADLLFPGEPHIGVYAESLDQLPPGWAENDRLIVKSHHPDEAATARLTHRADKVWISIRDPRDCVASAMTYMFPDFHSALDAVTRSAEHCERQILNPKCALLKYEGGFIDDPTTLNQFAATYSRSLLPQDRDRLFQKMRRPAIESMIQEFKPNETVDDGFPGHRVHLKTQWHTHHLHRTGEIGRWRHTLTAAESSEIHRRLGPWMERFDYH